MKTRGIIFTGPMVRKILVGKKTQTRRLIPASAILFGRVVGRPRYGVPGDRLWVRERWRTMEHPLTRIDGIVYAADSVFMPIANTAAAADAWVAAHDNGRHGTSWRSPIYMPRWAARLELAITMLRIERLQSITEDDITAEGLGPIAYDKVAEHPWILQTEQRSEFARGWDEINGKRKGGSWDKNPWVWVLGFRVLPRPEVDRTPKIIPHETTCDCWQCERSHDL